MSRLRDNSRGAFKALALVLAIVAMLAISIAAAPGRALALDPDVSKGRMKSEFLSSSSSLSPSTTIGSAGYSVDGSMSLLSQKNTDGGASTILADVIFSEATASSADSISLPLKTLEMYGYGGSASGTYGALQKNASGVDGSGKTAAARIKQMYSNGWVLGVPKSDNNVVDFFAGIYKTLAGDQSTIQANITAKGLQGATLFANVYDISIMLTSAIYKAVSTIDIPVILGLTAPQGIARTAVAPGEENAVTSILTGIFSAFGLDLTLVETASVITKTVFITMFFILLLAAFMKARGGLSGDKQRLGRSFGFLFRAVVIICSVFLIFAMTDIANMMNNFIAESKNATTRDANSQVVDTLVWSAVDNFGDAEVSNASEENVKALTDRLNGYSLKGVNDGSALISAASQIGALASAETFTVNDWIGVVETNENTLTRATLRNIKDGIYFFYTPDNSKDTSSFEAIDSYNESIVSGDALKRFEESQVSGKTGANGIEYDESAQELSVIFEPGSVDGDGQSTEIPVKLDKMLPARVSSNDLKTFLYGAWSGTSLPEEARDFANYVGGKSAQSSGARWGDVDQLGRSMLLANSLRIGVINKFAGVDSNKKAFSAQSTMMLIQSSYDSSTQTLLYQGVNTTPSETGQGKDTGRNGASMVRYTIPSNSDEELAVKCWHITVSWIGATIVSVVALILIIKLPLLNCLYRMVRGIIGAMLTGNVFDLADYVLFYMAMRLSFVFAFAASSLGIAAGALASQIVNAFGFATGSTLAGTTTIDPLGYIGGVATGAMCQIFVVGLISFLLVYPMMKIPRLKGSRKGQIDKVCVLELVMSIPFIMAETLSESFRGLEEYVYGRKSSVSRTIGKNLRFGRKRDNQLSLSQVSAITAEERKEEAKEKAMAVATTGAQIIGAGVTGGAVGAGEKAAELAVGALKKSSGLDEIALPSRDESLAMLGLGEKDAGESGTGANRFSGIYDADALAGQEADESARRLRDAESKADADYDAALKELNAEEEAALEAAASDGAVDEPGAIKPDPVVTNAGRDGSMSTAPAGTTQSGESAGGADASGDEPAGTHGEKAGGKASKPASEHGEKAESASTLNVGEVKAGKVSAAELSGATPAAVAAAATMAMSSAAAADDASASVAEKDARLLKPDEQYEVDTAAAGESLKKAVEAASGNPELVAAAYAAHDEAMRDAKMSLISRNTEAERGKLGAERDEAVREARKEHEAVMQPQADRAAVKSAAEAGAANAMAVNDARVNAAVESIRHEAALRNFENAESAVAKVVAAAQVAATSYSKAKAGGAVKSGSRSAEAVKLEAESVGKIASAVQSSSSPAEVIAAANASARSVEQALERHEAASKKAGGQARAASVAARVERPSGEPPVVEVRRADAADTPMRELMDRERELKAMEDLADVMRDVADGSGNNVAAAAEAAAELERIARERDIENRRKA